MSCLIQNVLMAAVPPEQRAGPTIEQLIENGFSGRGGCCYQLNYFLHLILVALEFDTIVISGTFIPGIQDCHLMTIVRLDENEEYLLDVACGNPLDVPIPLHQLPYKRTILDDKEIDISYEYRPLTTPIEFANVEDDHGRFQVGGSLFLGEYKHEPKERVRFTFSKIPRTFDYFQYPMHDIFTVPNEFLRHPFLFRYLKHEFTEPEDTEWVLIYGLYTMIGGKNGRKVTTYKTYEAIEEVIWKYFPGLDKEQVKKSMEHFNKNIHLEKEPSC